MPRPEPGAPVDPGAVRRVLVIRHRAGGDLLLSTPALHALRRGLPGASIEVLTGLGFRELLAGNPDVDRVIELDRRSLRSQAALYVTLARGGYDLVIDMVSNPRTALMTLLTRARTRVGYDLPGRRGAYTLAIPREPIGPDGPIVRYAPEAALDLVRAVGLPAEDTALRFRVDDGAGARMDQWIGTAGLPEERPIVACVPAGSWPAKTWPPERFVAALDELAPEASVLWVWGPGEESLAAACRSAMRHPSWIAPRTGWQELGALLRRASLWIGNDSGPKHVAVALGVPTVTIFGPTHPGTWHPASGPHVALMVEGLDCLHCNANVCPLPGTRHMLCMRDLAPSTVVAAARRLLHGATRGAPCASR